MICIYYLEIPESCHWSKRVNPSVGLTRSYCQRLRLTRFLGLTLAISLDRRWSGKINRQIYQQYADAMASATEAINNLRTVRAFSAEPRELGKVCLPLCLSIFIMYIYIDVGAFNLQGVRCKYNLRTVRAFSAEPRELGKVCISCVYLSVHLSNFILYI